MVRIAGRLSLVAWVTLSWATAAGQDAAETRPLKLLVVDSETGTPVAGAELEVRIGDERERLKTDADGSLTVDVPVEQPDYVRATVRDAPGYVGMTISWYNSKTRQTPLPDTHTFPLPAAQSIGGRVIDAKGDPVARARVNLLLTGSNDMSTNRLAIDNNRPIARTDDEGYWTFDGAPPDLQEFWMRVDHHDFPSDRVWDLKPPPEELYRHGSVITLKLGLSIAGRVVNEAGEPIARAKIYEGLWSSSGAPSVSSADDGKFTLKNLTSMRAVMTVHAKGYAPTMVVKTLKEDLEPVEVVLKPGRVLKLKVVDTAGKPITGARVQPGAWRGGESLRMWPLRATETGEEGMLIWDSAPEDSVEYSVLSEGLFPSEPVTIAADGEAHTVVMRAPVAVSGVATDATTGESVTEYNVFPVLYWKSGGSHISRANEYDVVDGKFEYQLMRLDCDHGVRIEARGYRPITTPAFDLSEQRRDFAFKLEPAADIQGRLVDLEGVPVENAKVTVCGALDQINIDDGKLDNHFNGFSVTPDADGAFSLAPQDGPYTVVAMNEIGYAEASGAALERTGELVLKPWASARGRLTRDGKAVSGVPLYLGTIRLQTNNYPIIIDRSYAQTATDGSFSFDNVAPGSVVLTASVSPWEQTELTSGERMPLFLRPGDAIEVDLGGAGIAVTGQLTLPGGDTREIAWNWALNYMYRKAPGVPAPEEVRDLGFSYEDGWNEAWVSTPEGRAYFDTLEGHFVKLTPDGGFRVDGVTPGDYELAFRVYDEPEGTCMVSPIGTATFDVRVASDADTLLDLGKLLVDIYPQFEVGAVAPSFSISTFDGGSLTLESLRGKYVLLDFWATWCGPCRDELPNLKGIWERYKDRDDFAIVGLNLDADADAAKRMIDDEELEWLQGHVGDWTASTLTKEYNVSGIPATFLVGPDGKLLARDMRGPLTVERVAEALGDR